MLEEKEFQVLSTLLYNEDKKIWTQRLMSERLGISLEDVNRLIEKLIEHHLIRNEEDCGYYITNEGCCALQPYSVKNAIIMAAGMSSRFAPLSYEKPKGLLNVKGEILIEREIRQLQEAGINDITIVVGYMKEKFYYLEEKFGVKIVVNEDYYRYNNTSTLMCVLDRLSNTYICSSDNYFVDNVFESYVYRPYYSAVYADGETDEYCLKCSSEGKIKEVTIGGHDAWYMCGHVYFDQKFSRHFSEILKREYNNETTKNQLWEDLYIRYLRELDLYIRKYDGDKVLEFDSLDELRKFDETYNDNSDSKIMKNICDTLDCRIKDIAHIKAIKSGLTNNSFSFSVGNQKYVYRHPGKGTENYINRSSEAFSMKIASNLGLDGTYIHMDEKEGWKISYYIEEARELDYHNQDEVTAALKIMSKLHNAGVKSKYDFDIWNKSLGFVDLLKSSQMIHSEDFWSLLEKMKGVYKQVSGDNVEKCVCHCDCYSPNFLLDSNNKMYLIDWEYSGNDDPASDLGTFICCSDYEMDEAIDVIKQYAGNEISNKVLGHYMGYVAIASYYWYLWALYQEAMGKDVGEYLDIWHKNSIKYADKTFLLYRDFYCINS